MTQFIEDLFSWSIWCYIYQDLFCCKTESGKCSFLPGTHAMIITSSNTFIFFLQHKPDTVGLMLSDYHWTSTLFPFNINTALRRIFSKDLSDIEGCSSRPCQMRSVLTIMVRSSGGAASQLHNSLTASIILCSVSIDVHSSTHYKLQMHLTHSQGVPYH